MARRRGFTLIEVLVVMSLLAVLMGLSVGMIANSQTGNKLLVTTNAFTQQLAAARSQSFGSNSGYVLVHTAEDGRTSFRAFRNTQVLAWPAEDFAKASENVINRAGGVDISTDLGLEGHYAVFQPNGTIDLGDPPWLDFLDGFSIECRLRPDARAGVLFRKGPGLSVNVTQVSPGRLGLEAKILLQRDAEGHGEGIYELRTGMREGETVPEWSAPLLPGRWHDVRVSYDCNTFTIYVDGRLRAVRSDRRNRMALNDAAFVIGGGYQGGFDSLVISGIFESDETRYDAPEEIRRVMPDGKVATGDLFLFFRNRSLDPQRHAAPLQIWLEMDRGRTLEPARRVVTVSLSGEAFVRLPDEVSR